jgi:hypothetical protein
MTGVYFMKLNKILQNDLFLTWIIFFICRLTLNYLFLRVEHYLKGKFEVLEYHIKEIWVLLIRGVMRLRASWVPIPKNIKGLFRKK